MNQIFNKGEMRDHNVMRALDVCICDTYQMALKEKARQWQRHNQILTHF